MSEQFDKLTAAYEEAVGVGDKAEQERILRRHCGDDARLLAQVRAMLATPPDDSFLEPVSMLREALTSAPSFGGYEQVEKLADGPCAAVWIARQPSCDQRLALKVMTTGPNTPMAQIERFHRTPRAAAALQHPHIMPVYADGFDVRVHWLVMPLVDGHSLAEELRRQRAGDPHAQQTLLPAFGTGPWFRAVAQICADAADALSAAHQHGIVHGNVKPQNLLLDRNGAVLVTDFGARNEQIDLHAATSPQDGCHYMSPEQWQIGRGAIDHRTDIYSLGVVLFELLTGSKPFDGRSPREVRANLRRQPTPSVRRLASSVPRDLEIACLAAIERSADRRYARPVTRPRSSCWPRSHRTIG